MNKAWKKFSQYIQIKSGAEALAAALFSVTGTVGVMLCLWKTLYGRLPIYTELIAGGTVWDGYYKQGDMTLFYAMYVFVPLFFCLFLLLKHKVEEKKEINPNGSAVKKKLPQSAVRQTEQISKVIVALLLGVESVRAIETAATAFMPYRQGQLQLLGIIGRIGWSVCILIFLLFLNRKKKDIKQGTDGLLMVSQLLLPLQFLGYYKFYYVFESEEGLISLFYSRKWKWACILLCIGFLGCQIWHLWKQKRGIYLSSLLLVGVAHVANTPEGILSVDFFHNGEMAFPMQQLMNYGKVPYFDLDPIHGLCDYFYSALNYLFFDGSYFAQNGAIFVAEIGMAILLSLVLGLCVKNKTMAFFAIYLFMPYFVEQAGVRYLLFFVAFLILFSEKVRENSFRFLWWWVLLCIVAIFWNVSIGSSMAVAFLPEVLYRFIKDIIPGLKRWKQWEQSEKKKFLISYGFLFVIGISYIPWFFQILRFLSENAGTTLYVNGTAIFGSEFKPLQTFALMLPYMAVLIYALLGHARGKSAWVTMTVCLFVISNYACVRYDEGARLVVLSVFFMLIFGLLIGAEKEMNLKIRYTIVLLFLGMSLLLMGKNLPAVGNTMKAAKIPAVREIRIMGEAVNDPVVYVSGESVGMPALGTGFIQGSTLNSLKNIQIVLEAEGGEDAYLDLTNKISHYVIFDKESVLPFTSAYNISNTKMQEKAIALVKEKKPHLILLSPLIQFDLAPVSIRSMSFYQSLIEMGYEPYVYGDVVYLLEGAPRLEAAVDGTESMGMICHKEYMGMLPAIWGISRKADAEGFGLQEVTGTEHGILDGREVSYIEVCTKEALEGKQWRFSFVSDVDNEVHSFVMEGTNEGVYLLPVGSSPFWHQSLMEGYTIDGIEDYQVKLFQ